MSKKVLVITHYPSKFKNDEGIIEEGVKIQKEYIRNRQTVFTKGCIYFEIHNRGTEACFIDNKDFDLQAGESFSPNKYDSKKYVDDTKIYFAGDFEITRDVNDIGNVNITNSTT